MFGNSRKVFGFTLIELLVVISLIALLLGLLIPALQIARQQATASACLSNQHTLSLAWVMYADENDGYLVGDNTWPYTDCEKIAWVKAPMYENGDMIPGPPEDLTYEMKVRGIMHGLLWPYIKDINAYHCPGDRRKIRNVGVHHTAFRSYAITWQMNGHYGDNWWNNAPEDWHIGEIVRKITSIKQPGLKFVFLEDYDDRGWGMGCFVLDGSPDAWTWTSPMPTWHNNQSTQGFADGHAEMHKWNRESMIYFNDPFEGGWDKANQPGNPDLAYAKKRILPTGKTILPDGSKR